MLCYNKFQNVVFSGKQSLSFIFFFWILKWLDKFSFVYFLWLTFLWVRTFFIIFFSWKMFDLNLKNTSFFFKFNKVSLVYFSKDTNKTSNYFFQIINRLLFENFYKNLNNGYWSVFYKFSRIRPLISKRRRSFNFFKPFLKLKRLTFFFKRTKHNIFRKILKSYFLFICLIFFICIRYKKFRRFFLSSRSFRLAHFLKSILNYCSKKRSYLILFLSFFHLFGKKFFKVSHYIYKYLKYFSFSFLKKFFNRNTNLLNIDDFMQMLTWKNKYTTYNLLNYIPFFKKEKFPLHQLKKIFKKPLKKSKYKFLKKSKYKNDSILICKLRNALNYVISEGIVYANKATIKSDLNDFIVAQNWNKMKRTDIQLKEKVLKSNNLYDNLMKAPLFNSYNYLRYVLNYTGMHFNINKSYPKSKYLQLTKGLKKSYKIYNTVWNKNNHLKKRFEKLKSIFGNISNMSFIKDYTWRYLKFQDLSHNLMFLDRFLILRDWEHFYLNFRNDVYYNYFYLNGISLKMLKHRTKFKDLQDKEPKIDKNKNIISVLNKNRKLVVYYEKNNIIIATRNKKNNYFFIDNKLNQNVKNKIRWTIRDKNKIIINNKDKNKKFYFTKNTINIETKNKYEFRINSLNEPVSFILQKPDFGFFLNSLNNNNFSTFNLGFLSNLFKKFIFFFSLKKKNLLGLTSFDSGLNGFFIPFILKKQQKNFQYGFFIPFFKFFDFELFQDKTLNQKINENFKKLKKLIMFHLKKHKYISLNDFILLQNNKLSIQQFFENLYYILYKNNFPFGRFVSENAKNVLNKKFTSHLFFYKFLWILICKFLYKDHLFLLSLRPAILNKFLNIIQKTNKYYNTIIKRNYYLPFFDKQVSTTLDNNFYSMFSNFKAFFLNKKKALKYKKAYKFEKLSSKKKYYNFFFKVLNVKIIPFEKSKNFKRLQKLLTSKKYYHKFIIRKYTSKYCKFSYFFKYVFKSKNKKFKKRLTKRTYCFRRLKRLKKGINKFNKKKMKKLNKRFRKPLLRQWLRKMRKSVIKVLRKQLICLFFGINTLILKDLFFNKKVKYLHHFFFTHPFTNNYSYNNSPKNIFKPASFVSYKFNNYMNYDNSSFNKKLHLSFFTVNHIGLNYHRHYNLNSLNFFY